MSIRKDKPQRVRRSPEDSRANILAAAERILTESGPKALRLADVAKEAGVANATVLHHFGTIEGVHAELMERMIADLIERVLAIELTEDTEASRASALTTLFEAFEQKQASRLAAWLELSGETHRLKNVRQAVREVTQTKFHHQNVPEEFVEDVMLVCITLALGVGLFGPTLSEMLGKPQSRAKEMALSILMLGLRQLDAEREAQNPSTPNA
ncbi:TetR/AcrR family transcriptional regulator [Ponticaulis sp.]|uniref:TetR/AcrR family transcriptional regulator n=1 Tax=Ponticaulis sp. TaxID=2020902 RepID=UPI000B6AFB03|nr:TetR/AcrR family transcriptional regulator [Ponticaulis sp.]MAI90451.1 TetR family transcriptional regulator [Ponticaulis sp.]OUY00150.1 MAG: TetR family transcriptional regulator [Hyphomonadaceae bacterium TMED5]|tara:strand:+ start:68047 stop:68682 length:636 start_codon:yes stop_codon:yes gene_type:complete